MALINKSNLILSSFKNLEEIEKGRYVDNPKNRKLNRVGQEYRGSKGKDSKEGNKVKKEGTQSSNWKLKLPNEYTSPFEGGPLGGHDAVDVLLNELGGHNDVVEATIMKLGLKGEEESKVREQFQNEFEREGIVNMGRGGNYETPADILDALVSHYVKEFNLSPKPSNDKPSLKQQNTTEKEGAKKVGQKYNPDKMIKGQPEENLKKISEKYPKTKQYLESQTSPILPYKDSGGTIDVGGNKWIVLGVTENKKDIKIFNPKTNSVGHSPIKDYLSHIGEGKGKKLSDVIFDM